eukprot:jgi/Psemu1/315021/fgenesh1_kg.1825_\
MAPNRKTHELFATTADLESLRSTIQPKYLPLTIGHSPRDAQQDLQEQEQECHYQQELVTDTKREKEPRTVSYWDWTSDTKEEEEEAAVDDLFSLSRFETNLVADALRREVETKDATTTHTEESQSYWEWSDTVEVTDCETDTEEDETTPPATNQPDSHCEECCRDYWAWDEESDHNEESLPSRTTHLHNLLNNSRKKYHRRHSHLPEPEDPETDAEHASEHYWHWSEFHSASATTVR